MKNDSRIFVAGHRGLVGGAILRVLQARGYHDLITRPRAELDLTVAADVTQFFEREKPEYVFLAAAKVGGIHANATYPADFLRENLAIQCNVIDAAWRNGVQKLLFLGSSCIYPRDCPQPIREEYLMSGPLEETNEAYAIAKIAGLKMCQAYNRQHGTRFISVMPTNLYGPGDNYHLLNSHVIPALIRKFCEAMPDKPVTVWGTGTPRREFLYSDDLAEACLLVMELEDAPEILNVGCGEDISIRELCGKIQRTVGHQGEIVWDSSKPDGTPRKVLDISRLLALRWFPKVPLEEGIPRAYEDFIDQLQVKSVVSTVPVLRFGGV